MNHSSGSAVTIVGAGLAGGLLATLLARQGWRVDVFEKRPDPRLHGLEEGRSINLALAERGLHALRMAGLEGPVMREAVAMRGRMVHPAEGEATLLPYGRDDSEVIWSVHRGRLNLALLAGAEAAGARIHFGSRLARVDWEDGVASFVDDRSGVSLEHRFEALIGCDGAGSAVRGAMASAHDVEECFTPLDHGYKELTINPAPGGGFRLDAGALHIWPRGGFMCIALPNRDGSFTATAFLPEAGDPSLASLADPAAALDFFAREFPDLLSQIEDFEHQWRDNPSGSLGTLRVERWHLGGQALILGDAAHAMVPFHGQGMNCAFEDSLALSTLLLEEPDLEQAFAAFTADRRPNAEAIQKMALENYLEMRDQVADPHFLLRRDLERLLADRHPGRFIPRYSMVSFTRCPYATALRRGEVQRHILEELTTGKSLIGEVDMARADMLVTTRLEPIGSPIE